MPYGQTQAPVARTYSYAWYRLRWQELKSVTTSSCKDGSCRRGQTAWPGCRPGFPVWRRASSGGIVMVSSSAIVSKIRAPGASLFSWSTNHVFRWTAEIPDPACRPPGDRQKEPGTPLSNQRPGSLGLALIRVSIQNTDQVPPSPRHARLPRKVFRRRSVKH